MKDELLNRYSRHILLPEIDIAGQQRLAAAHALIFGLGGLGSPVAMYLASSGIGQLTLCDPDRVELSNLQRQVIHGTSDIGRIKSQSAADTLRDLNPACHIETVTHILHGAELEQAVRQASIVIDATDNFDSRYALNRACVGTGTPLVSGAVTKFEGQLSIFHASENRPCYHCLYPDETSPGNGHCSENGVLAPFAGVIGCLMACETIKWLCGAGDCLLNQLLTINIKTLSWRTTRIHKDTHCPVCTGAASRFSAA